MSDHPDRVVVAVEAGDLPASPDALVEACTRAVRATGLAGAVSVALIDDASMRAVNRDYHDCDEPTDVLAFSLDGEGMALPAEAFDFEIVVSVETAVRESRARCVEPVAEVALYVVHGALHLLGFDDHDPDDARRMHARTLEILGALGVRNEIEVDG